jgi:hypothetical protein
MGNAAGMAENGEQFTVLPGDDRQDFLKGISDDAAYLATAMKPFGKLCKTADAAAVARDEYFTQKMKNPQFADAVQRIRDWGSAKRNNETLTIDGKTYKSVKVFFKKELGVTYEHVLRYTAKNLPRLNFLLGDDDQQQAQAGTPPAPAQAKVNVPPAAQGTPPPAAAPQPEILAVHGFDKSFSLADKVESAYEYVVSCTADLSAAEKDEFYGDLIARLNDEADEVQGEI